MPYQAKELPPEVMERILSYLPAHDLIRFRQVNRTFNAHCVYLLTNDCAPLMSRIRKCREETIKQTPIFRFPTVTTHADFLDLLRSLLVKQHHLDKLIHLVSATIALEGLALTYVTLGETGPLHLFSSAWNARNRKDLHVLIPVKILEAAKDLLTSEVMTLEAGKYRINEENSSKLITLITLKNAARAHFIRSHFQHYKGTSQERRFRLLKANCAISRMIHDYHTVIVDVIVQRLRLFSHSAGLRHFRCMLDLCCCSSIASRAHIYRPHLTFQRASFMEKILHLHPCLDIRRLDIRRFAITAFMIYVTVSIYGPKYLDIRPKKI